MIAFLLSCEPSSIPGGGGGGGEVITGRVEFEFPLDVMRIPDRGLHRIDLSLAKNAKNLYQGDFIQSANVSDVQLTYVFELPPGNYYWQAGITCSSKGDTCLWGGFPGGRYGAKWTLGTIDIEIGKTTQKKITFQ